MKTLAIRWQRLQDAQGRTCDRCGATEAEVDRAVRTLREALKPLGIDVALEKGSLRPEAFAEDPLQSNRIWIDGRPIEDWISGSTGKSPCCSTCGDAECRTVTVGGRTYETVPAALIVQAGLLAAAGKIPDDRGPGCCSGS